MTTIEQPRNMINETSKCCCAVLCALERFIVYYWFAVAINNMEGNSDIYKSLHVLREAYCELQFSIWNALPLAMQWKMLGPNLECL